MAGINQPSVDVLSESPYEDGGTEDASAMEGDPLEALENGSFVRSDDEDDDNAGFSDDRHHLPIPVETEPVSAAPVSAEVNRRRPGQPFDREYDEDGDGDEESSGRCSDDLAGKQKRRRKKKSAGEESPSHVANDGSSGSSRQYFRRNERQRRRVSPKVAKESIVVTKDDGDSSLAASGVPTAAEHTEDSAGGMSALATSLPWGGGKERAPFPAAIPVDVETKPGEFVMRTLFAEFTVLAEKKIEAVVQEPDRPLKTLQRGEDPVMDQILNSLGSLAEHCLPSILKTLLLWFERQGVEDHWASPDHKQQNKADQKGKSDGGEKSTVDGKRDALTQRRDLAVEFIFCLVLVEVLKQLPFHPGHNDLISRIETMAFAHFKHKEGLEANPNGANMHLIADLYAEVVGVLVQSRFHSVRQRFMAELKELRSKEPGIHATESVQSLMLGMRFFRVKMVPIEEFEASFQFLQECAQYFTACVGKQFRISVQTWCQNCSMAFLLQQVKTEVNVPVLKNFVEGLYSQTLDSSTKKKQSLSLFPLVTCLLCVSQKTFFLSNWHQFLTLCLQQLKSRDSKMARVALESLYRLIWVYMIRIKCESNTATHSRLQSIVNSLFPKGSKGVVPRDVPLSIFVKIIQFIAQERLDFAMREIIFELLSVGRQINKFVLTPERFSIGLRAFLVIADALQQKEGEPPMPQNFAPLPSGSTLRVKKTYLTKTLTDDTARSLGLHTYYPHVKKVFGDILRALDSQVGRPLMMTSSQNANKEPIEIMTEDRKPKIDLFRTSIAAVPRLMPEGLSKTDLLELLCRLTVHFDDELRGHACQSMQTMTHDFPTWRGDVVQTYIGFLVKEVGDTHTQFVDQGLRIIIQLLATWKNALHADAGETKNGKNDKKSSGNADKKMHLAAGGVDHSLEKNSALIEQHIAVLHAVEGYAMVKLCNVRLVPRRLAVTILREVKILGKTLRGSPHVNDEEWVSDVLDQLCPTVIETCLPLLPQVEKTAFLSSPSVDMHWLVERSNTIWTAGFLESSEPGGGAKSGLPPSSNPTGDISDPWAKCLIGFLNKDFIHKRCRSASVHAWSISFHRLNALFSVIDPNPINEQRASLLRSASAVKKPTTEKDISLGLWKNYAVFACRVVPANVPMAIRCASPDLGPSSSPESWLGEKADGHKINALSHIMSIVPQSPTALYKLLTPLLRCESVGVRDAAVLALGAVNHAAIKDLMEELVSYIREALDRKQENMRRRRRRDALRLQLVRVFHLIAQIGTFGISSCVLDKDQQSLHPSFVEYIDGARLYLESDNDKDVPALKDIKTHFCGFITSLISSFSLDVRQSLLSPDLRRNLFRLFSSWSGKYGTVSLTAQQLKTQQLLQEQIVQDRLTDFEFSALQAQCASLCCGRCFDHKEKLDDGVLYPWLNKIMSSADEKVAALGHDTLVLLLEFNFEVGALLDWAVDRCYTAIPQVGDSCFRAIAALFGSREYPCDHYTAIINVTLLNVGCPRAVIQDTAFHLLLILDQRFFGKALDPPIFDEDGDHGLRHGVPRTLDETLSTSVYCRSQIHLSRQLAYLHPELTMPIFSEITYRFKSARPPVRQLLLSYLLPWLSNMELIDRHVPPANPLDDIQYNSDNSPARMGTCRDGMGSVEATEMVLNNLFYITAEFGDEFPDELESIWSSLCSCWPNNLRVILRYLLIVTGMAPDRLLPFSKRVVLYMGRSRPSHLVDELMAELQTVEALNFLIERMERPPFFRLTCVRKGSTHSENGAGVMDESVSTVATLLAPPSSANVTSELPPTSSGTSASPSAGTVRERSASGATNKKLSEDSSRLQEFKADLQASGSIRSGASSLSSGGSVVTRADRSTVRNLYAASHDDSGVQQEDNFSFFRRQQSESSGKKGRVSWEHQQGDEISHPRPLPMPEYGGYFAPLSVYLPESSQTPSQFHRSNLAVMFLSDVVVAGLPGVDWWVHLPTMLHMIFLGLDHARQLVHDHCERLLLNLLVVLGGHSDHWTVARVLLDSRTDKATVNPASTSPLLPTHLIINFTEPSEDFKKFVQNPCASSENPIGGKSAAVSGDEMKGRSSPIQGAQISAGLNTPVAGVVSRPTPVIVAPDGDVLDVSQGSSSSPSRALQTSSTSGDQAPCASQMTLPELTAALIYFLSSRLGQPMWNYEDVTGRVWHIKSADQLSWLVKSITLALRSALPPPHVRLDERWSQIALHLALSSSSRHFAGRSLQVFRALCVPVNTRMLSDILTRLVETVAEQGEDMQGYVVELMLTLEAIVDSLDAAEDRLEWQAPPGPQTSLSVKDESSKPPVGAQGLTSRSRATSAITSSASAGQNAGNHVRSTSYSVSYSSKKPAPGSPTCEHRDVRTRGSAEGVEPGRVGVRGFSQANSAPGSSATNLSRSRSAQSLRAIGAGFDATSSQEDKLTIMAQLFCIAISLLESDYEHEFLLALRLIDKVSERFDLEKPECRDRVDRLIRQMRWPSFPGVHSLLLKGLTNPSTYEQSLRMISQMTTALDLHVIDPSQTVAFPLNVVALLPYMLHHYEDANELCVRSADKIAEICTEKSAKLENLATVMTLYSRRTFSKESFQWTKCVVKYLHDAYSHLSPTIISFLVEVLDHGPLLVHAPILSILHCLLHYVDIHAQKSQILNIDLLRPVAKFLESNNWKEALKILRLVVTRSSSLVVPPSHQLQSQSSSWGFMPSSNSLGFTIPNVHRSNYTEGSSAYKKELPGRTMEFSFDMSLTPIIAKKFPAVPSSSGPPPYSLKDPIDANGDRTKHKREDGSLTPKRSPSQTATDSVIVPGWKRPYMSQARTREKLVNLLTSCGQRIGLPKSPSVIFSQTSEVIEHPMSSMASSMEEVSPHDGSIGGGGGGRDGAASSDGKLGEESSSDAQFTVFKDFDFLENEESGGESEDNFNWGVKRSTLDLRGGASGSLGDPKETPPTSERSSQPNSESVLQPHSVASDDVVTAHARGAGSGASAATAADDYPSSEEETGGSVSPLEHLSRLSEGGGRRSRVGATPTGPTGKASTSKPPPSSLVIGHGRRRRRQSQDSDSSYVHSSSDGDAGDLTPCNASPCLSSILSPHVQAEGAPPPPPLSMSTSSASENLSVVVPPTASMKASPESGGKSSVELIEPKQPEPELLGDTPMRHQQWVESEWRNLVTSLTIPMASRDFQAKPVLIAATPLRFTQLYKSLGVGLGSLVQMACDLLASESPDPWLSPLLIQLGNLSHTLTHTHPPFLWLDSWSVSSNAPASVLDMAKFNVLEIHEHFETFLDKREHAIECLEGVRSSLKLQALGEEPQIPGAYLIYMQDHQMDLSKAVNRLGFQLVSIWDSFTKLIASLYPYLVPNCRSIWDDAKEVRREMCAAMEAAESGVGFPDFDWTDEGKRSEQRASDAECSESEAEQAVLTSRRHQEGAIGEDSLGDLLLRKQWKKAWDEFKLHRSVFSVELNNMADDMMAILHIYCKAYSTKYRGLFCLPADLIALQETISPLKESLMHLMTSLRQAEHNVASSAVSTSSKDSMQRSYC